MDDGAGRRDGGGAGVRVLVARADLDAALRLREAVFCDEQGVSLAAEHDGRDGSAIHLGAFADGALVGTARLLAGEGELVVGRVAVRSDRRAQGLGRALMAVARAEALRLGLPTLSLHAQLSSEGFYARLGFARVGRPFLEEGIPHVTMRAPAVS